jgi:KDO transferase-3
MPAYRAARSSPGLGLRRLLIRLSARLEEHCSGTTSRKWVTKLYRAALDRPYKHRSLCSPRFQLAPTEGGYAVLWNDRVVSRTEAPTFLRDSQSGGAFLVAAGPSLADLDLRILRDRPVMTVNGSMARLLEAGVSPDYFMVLDQDFFRHRWEIVRQGIEAAHCCLFSAEGLNEICLREPGLFQRHPLLLQVCNAAYLQPRLSIDDFIARNHDNPALLFAKREAQLAADKLIGWSNDIEQGVFAGRTVTYAGLQVLKYLGFRRIYILGMDLGHGEGRPRCYGEGETPRPSGLERDYERFILPSFRLLQKITATEEFRVFNLSPVSRLPADVLPRLSLDEALAAAD